jgi:hypothetical protein
MKIDIDIKTILILLLLIMAIYQEKIFRLYHVLESLMNNDSMFGNVVNRISQKMNPHSFIHSSFTPQRPITRGYGHNYHSHHGGYHKHYDKYYPEEKYHRHTESQEIIPYEEQHLTCQNGLFMLYFNNKPFVTGINPLLFQAYDEYLKFVHYKQEMGEPYPILKCKNNTEQEQYLTCQNGLYMLYFNNKPFVTGINPLIFQNYNEYLKFVNYKKESGEPYPVLKCKDENESNTIPAHTHDNMNGFGELKHVGTDNKVFFDPPPIDVKNKQTSIYNKTQENKELGNSNNFNVTYTPNINDDGEIKPINSQLSDNAMESNWGGVVYSQNHVNGGYYL